MTTLSFKLISEEKSRGSFTLASMDHDSLIFRKIKDGDENAFEHLFRKYYLRLCHFASRYTHDMSLAEELVQETFIKIWENRKEITIHSSVKSYLHQTIANRGLNAIRKEKTKEGHLKLVSIRKSQPPDAIENLSANEVSEKLFDALENLPPKCKKIFEMSRLEGLKHKDIAHKLDINIKTVENQIGIALKHLRRILSDHLLVILSIFFINI